jgi:hypothetical protein
MCESLYTLQARGYFFSLSIQVSEGLILYQHMDLENTGWTAEDSFTFTVSSPPAALSPEEFYITISYEIPEPGRQSYLLANTGNVTKIRLVPYLY